MKKAIHISVIFTILVFIIFFAIIICLKYNETGETNMPFVISKISIISNTDANNNEDSENLWNKSVVLNNDIYFYIEKNPNYTKQALIKEILIKNVSLNDVSKGKIKTFKPSNNEKMLFENNDDYGFEELSYSGGDKTDIKNLLISNQGGIFAFRVSQQDLGNYVSNDAELNYKDLLKKINLSFDDLKFNVNFNIILVLDNNKEFETSITLQLPCDDIIDKGTSSKEISNLNVIFKRIEK